MTPRRRPRSMPSSPMRETSRAVWATQTTREGELVQATAAELHPGEHVRSHGAHVSRRLREAAAHAAGAHRVTTGFRAMTDMESPQPSSRIEREVLEILERADAQPAPVGNCNRHCVINRRR